MLGPIPSRGRLLGWLDAQARALVVLTALPDSNLPAKLVGRVTPRPRVADEPMGGVPATLFRPGRGRSWPGLVFVNGVTAEGRRHPRVLRLAEGLARAGFLVCVPDPAGLARGPIDERTVKATTAAIGAVADRSDVRGGRVGLIGVSLGASLALLAAEDEGLVDRVGIVAGIAPFADFVNVLRLATTGREPPTFLALVSARSLVATLPASAERDVLLGRLEELPPHTADAFAPLRADHADDGVRAVAELLLNRDARRFDALYAALSAQTRTRIAALSPIPRAGRLRAKVELAVGPSDAYLPLAELTAISRAATRTDVRLTVTSALGHAVPSLRPSGVAGLARLDGWLVRSLRAARMS